MYIRPLIITFPLLLFGINNSFAQQQNLEEIFLANPNNEGIEITVYTGGCTDKSDFNIIVEKAESNKISLIRKIKDNCKANIPPLPIQFTWEDLKLLKNSKLIIANPISAWVIGR